jgi:dephospho-CoA kinase
MRTASLLLRIGLTGGIAAGKSTVAERWRTQGARVIDTDALAHAALDPDTPTYRAIVEAFGTGILAPDRSIHRPALGEIVFGDEAKRQVLNGIVHPAVRRQWQETLRQWSTEGTTTTAVVMVPLLYEVGVESEFDLVVAVACSEATQVARLLAKGLSEPQARARIAAQWPMTRKMDRADYVIWNDGSERVLAEQCAVIWNEFKER